METNLPADWNETFICDSLMALCDPDSATILDLGCGDGERTTKYFRKAKHVVGVDPNRDILMENIARRPESIGELRHLVQARAEALPFPHEQFDIALMSWSL